MKWFEKLMKRLKCETYVRNVRILEKMRLTYLPDINGKYGGHLGNDGIRQMDKRDLEGRWSLGWRP